MATITQTNIELMLGGQWYVGKKVCVSGNGICISSSLVKSTTIYYDDATQDLWVEVPASSPAYRTLKDSVRITNDSPIDATVSKRLMMKKGTAYIERGMYKVFEENGVKTIHLSHFEL